MIEQLTMGEYEKLVEMLKADFMSRKECENTRHFSDEHIQRLEIAVTKFGTKLSIIIGILGAIGTALLGVLAITLF